MRHYPDLGNNSDWLEQIFSQSDALPDLGSDASSVWNFCAHFSDVISPASRNVNCFHRLLCFRILISHRKSRMLSNRQSKSRLKRTWKWLYYRKMTVTWTERTRRWPKNSFHFINMQHLVLTYRFWDGGYRKQKKQQTNKQTNTTLPFCSYI